MLKLVDITGIEEIELYVQLVRVKPQVNQLAGTYTNLLLEGNFNVEELDYGCGRSGGARILLKWGQSLIGMCIGFKTFSYNFFLGFSVGAKMVKTSKTLM